jgi:uncharacterized protein YggE
MRQLILTLIIIVFIAPFVQAEPELKGTPSVLSHYLSSIPEQVTLIGEATLEIQAQSGVVTMGIKTQATQLKTSLEKNQQLRNDITQKLISAGISKDKIKGTRFSSTPEYGFFGKKPNHYVVENILKITVDNERELQEVAGVVDSNSDVYYQGIELKEKNKEEIKRQLLDKALANAKSRQNVYETQLNITLTPIRFEEHISIGSPGFRPGPARKEKMALSSVPSEPVYSDDLSLGEHVYHGSVLISYRVTEKTK